MSRLTPERLAEIRARLNATSDGPWRAVVSRGTGAVMADALGCYVFLNVRRHPDEYTPDTVERWQRDAVFIANAKQDIPALLAELDAVTRERDEAHALAYHALGEDDATVCVFGRSRVPDKGGIWCECKQQCAIEDDDAA